MKRPETKALLLSAGALGGLAYVILLPAIGVLTIVVLAFRKLGMLLRDYFASREAEARSSR